MDGKRLGEPGRTEARDGSGDMCLLDEGVKLLPLGEGAHWCARRVCAPVQNSEGKTYFIFADPPSPAWLAEAKRLFGWQMPVKIASEESILSLLYAEGFPGLTEERQGPQREEVFSIVGDRRPKEAIDYPIRALLAWAFDQGFSDLHFVPEGGLCRVRGRKEGYLKKGFTLSQTTYEGILNKLKLLAQMDLAEKRLPQEGHIALETEQGPGDLRVSTIATRLGEHMVVRLLPAWQHMALEDLGFHTEGAQALRALLGRRQGLVLVTGPTNSGKTTTAYSLLQDMRHEGVAIYTVEDPVEIHMPAINQIQINRKIQLDFPKALRGILRQDPDVIFIGEIRDEETAHMALRAALTGHLVVASLHVPYAHLAVDRLRDLGASPHLLASSLIGVVNQRLVLRKGEGLDELAFSGRMGVQEIWCLDEEDRQGIQEGHWGRALRRRSVRKGFVSLWEEGRRREAAGLIDLADPRNAWFLKEEAHADL